MKKSPKNSGGISVIVNFCTADVQFIQRCVDSIQWQLAEEDELIILFNGHETDLPSVRVHPQTKGSICLTCTPKGISAARNQGWKSAKNPWIKFLDVDDLLAPFALNAIRQAASSFILHPSPLAAPSVLVGGHTVIHNGLFNCDIHRGFSTQDAGFINGRAALLGNGHRQMMTQNPMLVSHCAISRAALKAVGGFDERIQFEEDWDLWLKIHQKFGIQAFQCLPERLCYYTIDDTLRAAKKRDHTVAGLDVREYLKKTYGVNPA